MISHEIKFSFDCEIVDKQQIDSLFENIGNCLNVQFDENYIAYSQNNAEIYEFRDVSSLTSLNVDEIINSFFDFTFEDIINVPLYKFLVLKNNDKITILAIIHSSIFDYTSINEFHGLFNNSNDASFKNNILSYHKHVQEYLNSPDFDKDSVFWKKYLLDMGDYVKFFNIKSDNYKTIKIPIAPKMFSNFLKEYEISKFEFITSIFSLYLSRIDSTKGCLLKTSISSDGDKLDRNAILKIGYGDEQSFIDYMDNVKSVFDSVDEHTKVDIENYIDEDLSYYSVYDFTNLENVKVITGINSALTLNVYNDYLELVYNNDLFSDEYMENMVANINHLINNVLDSPNEQCKEIDIISDGEKELIFKFLKGPTVEVDKNKTLSMAFRENAMEYPDRIAIDDGICQKTYGDLEQSSNSIANDLSNDYGISLGEVIAVMLPRDYHFPEIVLALNKIGAAFVPIDSEYPLKRMQHMLNISKSKYIITTKKYEISKDLNTDLIYIEDLNDTNNVDFECRGTGKDLFAIMFTSGTTGLPKGVMMSNKQIAGVGRAVKSMYGSSPGDFSGCYASFSFAASFRMFFSMYFAESCRIFNEKERNDSLLLIQTLKNQPLNDSILPPAVGLSIIENDEINLKYMTVAGSKTNNLPKKDTNTKLLNLYGTTEILMVVSGILHVDRDVIPIGKPMDNTWVYILDDNYKPTPIGVPGKIYVSGDYMSPGYYGNPELTDGAYLDNPYCDCEDNKILYSTGDIAYYNFDGEIEIIGREDNQLSVRSFRIESEEILNIMNKFTEISEVYLDVDYDNLIAYYTTTDEINIDDVKEALKTELPKYMIPSLFVELDEIPLNMNGKIDKFAIKKISKEKSEMIIGDDVLKTVVDAFKNVLNRDHVLIDDNFVELGGNSLSAMNLQLILKENLDVNLYSNEIIELSTPVNIANHIKYNLNVHSKVSVNYTFDDSSPLLESQLNVYLDESVNEMNSGYNNPFKINFKKSFSVEEIENALFKLFEVYPILKSRVIIEGDSPRCIFDAEPEIKKGIPSDVKSFVKAFELDRYLSRFLIVEEGNSTSLCLDIHHMIFDGTSVNILLTTLLSILNNEAIDFIDDGILRQISFEENIYPEYTDSAKQFMDGMLADKDETYELLPSIDGDGNEFEYLNTFGIDKNYLSSFLQDHNITHNQFFASVFAYTLSRFAGSNKVLFNLLEDGRGHIDLSKSVGMFVRTLPVLIDCENQSVNSFLDYSSHLVNSVMKYDLYPFRILANEYGLNSDILFQYSHDLFYNASNKDEFGYEIEDLKEDVQGDLSFFIFDAGEDELRIRILYSDKFSKSFIEQFSESYKLILKEMMQVNELSQINYTSYSDLKSLDNFNAT